MEFVRTPRTGKTYTQRLLVLIGDEPAPDPWPTPGRDPRAAAEPRLDAWLARIIGGPRRVRFAARLDNAPLLRSVTLEQLDLSALAAVLASRRPGQDGSTELEDRIRHAIVEALPTEARDRPLTLLDDPPPGGNADFVGLAAFRALAHWAYDLITTHRPAAASDLALPQDEVVDEPDADELRGRADGLATAYASARQQVDAAAAAAAPTGPELVDALWGAAAFGVDGAVPPPPTAAEPVIADLQARLRKVAATMAAAADAEATLGAGGGATDRPADHQVARIRALLGPQFPVLLRFTVRDPAQLRASRGARQTLCDGDDLAPSEWLRRMALVRAGVERFARVRGGSELVHGESGPRDLAVLQLPHTPGERWLALPYPTDADGQVAVPAAQLTVVAHTVGEVDLDAPLAGVFVDGWAETIPGREETTGLAFHHDAPGSRAPQTILLAVPPAVTDPAWSVSIILDTIMEAQALARIRGVGPDRLEWLGTLLPAVRLPDWASPDIPAASLKRLAARTAAPPGGG
jgi:hypothetical protein